MDGLKAKVKEDCIKTKNDEIPKKHKEKASLCFLHGKRKKCWLQIQMSQGQKKKVLLAKRYYYQLTMIFVKHDETFTEKIATKDSTIKEVMFL